MSTTFNEADTHKPGLPKAAGVNEKTFILFYRFGNIPHNFEFFNMPADTTLPEAIGRGRQHCLAMNFRFLYVKPFVYDMEAAEQKKTGNN